MVKRVFNFVYQEVRGLHQAAYVLALFALASQVLAIVRDRLLAHTFGAGGELDVYYAAFRVPDLLFVLFASALSVFVLLPFVVQKTEQENTSEGTRVLSQMFTLFLVAYSILALLLAVLAPWYVTHLFPGLATSADTLTTLIRILLLQPLLLGISSLCGVVTQMNNRFVLYAISPLLYNIGIIIGVIVLYPMFGLSGLAYGVVIGAMGHVFVQLPYVWRSDFRFKAAWRFDWQLIRKILRVAVPRALTLSTNQLVMLVLISLATLMTVGSVAVFQFASNLQSVPLAIIGVSYSVAAFPTLSSLFAKQDQNGFNHQLLTAFRHIIFWSVPTIILVIVLRAQIVRVLLGSGEFDWSDTRLTAAVLAVFVLSLAVQAILLLLIRAFYACGRTFTPLWIALVSGSVTIGLAVWFQSIYVSNPAIQIFLENSLRLSSVAGSEVLVLVFAFVCGQFLQLALLMAMSVRLFTIEYTHLAPLLGQATVAALAGGATTYGALRFIVDGVNQETFLGILLQGMVAGIVGIVTVILVYRLCHSVELAEISKSLKSRFFSIPRSDSSQT
jgi:putative peptidoglycan lipid II flippase